jgi:cysteine-rich repeat protein
MRWLAILSFVAGCSASGDPCAGSTAVCIGLRIEGAVTGLDQLLFSIDTPNTMVEKSPDPPRGFTLPVRVALFPPTGTMGTVHISCDGTGGGALRGHGEADATLVSGHAEKTLTLIASGESDMPIPDLTGTVADGAGGDALLNVDLANCATVSACMDGDGCCPAGCTNATDHDCVAVCGNKTVESGEYCDDGNSVNGDGCDPSCQFLGQMTTLSGVAGACGNFDGRMIDPTTARFLGPFGGLATDFGDLSGGTSPKIWVSDTGTLTIRELTNFSTTSTIIGASFDGRLVDGSFAAARIHGDTASPLGFHGIPMTYVRANQKLYFTDSDGTNRLLREVDFTAKTVTTIPAATVTGNPGPIDNSYTENNLNLYYVTSNGDLDKWTIGSPSPTPIASASAINALFGGNSASCLSLHRTSGGATLLGCIGAVLQVLDNGTVTLYAGSPNNTGCVNSTGDLTARFNTPTGIIEDTNSIDEFDCSALRQVEQADGGVQTLAGQLGTVGFADSDTDAKSALFGGGGPMINSSSGPIIGDSNNCAVRYYVNGIPTQLRTMAGTSPATHAQSVRGTAALSRYVAQSAGPAPGGLASDGSTLFFSNYANGKGGAAGGTADTLVGIDLTSGTSTDLFSFGNNATVNDLTLLGGKLYVALDDGTIHRVDRTGLNDAVFAGVGGNVTGPPADGTPGNPQSAVIGPRALATDGTDLYFVDSNLLVRKITLATGTVSLVAGGQTGVVDGTAANAGFAFHFNTDLVYAKGALWMLDGGMGPYPNLVRRIDLTTREVKTMAGQGGSTVASSDGLGTGAQISGAGALATDGQSLFIGESGAFPFESATYSGAVPVAPVIRQLDLSTFAMTTFLGQRGFTSMVNDTGIKAVIHNPATMTFDASKHALFFFDGREGVLQKIR